MRFLSFLFGACFLSSLAQAQLLIDRQKQHETASEEFLNTHFFENGRGMTLSPDLSIFFGTLKKPAFPSLFVDPVVVKRYGFIQGDKQRYMGVFEVEYKKMRLAVLGCTACHSGKAAGVLIPGLGNKTIDPYTIGKDLKKIQKTWGALIQTKTANNPDYKYVHEKAMNFAQVIGDDRISNLTRGLVPDSVIKTFFYRDQGVAYGAEIQRTQVKVPSLWGYAVKRKVGVFADGSLNAENYAWSFGAELMASDSGEHLRASMPKIIHTVDNVIGNLLPPKYPFEIDTTAAERGKAIAQNTCFKCHGSHNRDTEGFPIYEVPTLIPNEFVMTDPQRLDYGNSLWVDLAEQGSVGDLIKFNRDLFNYGYFAPKLWGIWSRFPYLHNGSVPTIYDLMTPPEERPTFFSMQDAGEKYRFDKFKMGLTNYYPGDAAYKQAKAAAINGNRNIYYTGRPEHSNQGHYFSFMKNFTEQDRLDVIEYLKTL